MSICSCVCAVCVCVCQWCSPGYTQVYGVYPLIFQSALRIPISQNRAFILCCMGCLKKLRVYPLLQRPLHHWCVCVCVEVCVEVCVYGGVCGGVVSVEVWYLWR